MLNNKNVQALYLADHHDSISEEQTSNLDVIASELGKIFNHKHYVPEVNGDKYDKSGIGLTLDLVKEIYPNLEIPQAFPAFVQAVSRSDLLCSNSVAPELDKAVRKSAESVADKEVLGHFSEETLKYLGKDAQLHLVSSATDTALTQILTKGFKFPQPLPDNYYELVEQQFDVGYCVKYLDHQVFDKVYWPEGIRQ